ncbi:ADP-ribosylglycohydrolase family protein [Plectonema cf. radiosum LEGE 06105]|uniref:ADP-ribosylglycohydrolase family protein n=1 Tax=Plectonema cf. radiosum LEGE 06105 TaxID=945769 RepID=A0A8J7K0F4_9CYAN|nr:ADP-ribosylglycohydrolase family protein [Plectonema radiosum]MBE9211272.1 ADP-ribosylglycohydrolase family protein [Plectonema cf. radiosum LEGE 06105]
MRYSLTSRVRGALVGCLIGQILAARVAEQPLLWSKAAVQGINSLLSTQGRFDLDQWNKIQQQTWDLEAPCDLVLADLILSTLPIALFFHENNLKLRENLLLAIQKYHHPLLKDGVLAVCYLIAQSLNEKLNCNTLVSEITAFIGETTTDVPKKLQQVNNLLIENAGLVELQNCLGKENNLINNIATAFYCFASNQEDFRLTCLRTITTNNQNSQIPSAIAGAISGAYNSMAGIPITWHLGLDRTKLVVSGQLTSFSQMVKLADALVAVWSGAYQVSPQFLEKKEVDLDLIFPQQAIAAPHIIRLR